VGSSLCDRQLVVRSRSRQNPLTEEAICNHPHHGDLPAFLPGHDFLYSILQPENRACSADESAEIYRGRRD
jgi:hypothetical protein